MERLETAFCGFAVGLARTDACRRPGLVPIFLREAPNNIRGLRKSMYPRALSDVDELRCTHAESWEALGGRP